MPEKITIKVPSSFEGYGLAKFLMKSKVEVPYGLIQKLLRKRAIKVNGKNVKQSFLLTEGDEILIPGKPKEKFLDENPDYKPLEHVGTIEDAEKYLIKNIIYKDENVIAINKPQGIATQGGTGVVISVDSLLDFLKFDYTERPHLVHRLDKDTSGVLLLARTREAAQILGDGFKHRLIEKTYLALVVGRVPVPRGRIAKPLGKRRSAGGAEKMMVDYENGKIAVTEYKVVEHFGGRLTLLEVFPKTGRKHQIRIHLAEEGFPILGDGKYGGSKAFIDGLPNKLHLHSWKATHKDGYFKPIESKPRKEFRVME